MTKKLTELLIEGAFVYIGTEPLTKMFNGQVETDQTGYIVAAEDTKTNIPGVFAAGDVRTKPTRQVITAASDGAASGIMAERYVVMLQI
jgi:thioredoxin reductase (NADPH)